LVFRWSLALYIGEFHQLCNFHLRTCGFGVGFAVLIGGRWISVLSGRLVGQEVFFEIGYGQSAAQVEPGLSFTSALQPEGSAFSATGTASPVSRIWTKHHAALDTYQRSSLNP